MVFGLGLVLVQEFAFAVLAGAKYTSSACTLKNVLLQHVSNRAQ